MAASDISYGAAVKLRGTLSDLVTKAQTAASTVTAALASITGSTALAAQASAAAAASRDGAAAAATAAAASAGVVATAQTVAQSQINAAAASASAAAASAAAATASAAALNASKGAAGGIAGLDSSSKLQSANFDFASSGTILAGTDTARPVNSLGVQAAIAALSSTFGTLLAGKLSSSSIGQALGIAGLDSNGKLPATQAPTTMLLAGQVGAANGIAALDAGGRAPLAQLQVRTAQVTRAARAVLVTAGGSFSSFLSAQGGPDATDGTWEAIYVEAFAPSGGILYGALNTYLQSLGLSSSAATTQLTAIWSAAAAIAP